MSKMLELRTTTRPTHEALGIFGHIPFVSATIIALGSRLTGRTILPDSTTIGEARQLMQQKSIISPDHKTEIRTTAHIIEPAEIPDL